MKRISRTSIDANVLRQSRNIRTWFVFGLALALFGLLYGLDAFLNPWEYTRHHVYLFIVMVMIGGSIMFVSAWMIGRLPSASKTHVYEASRPEPRAIIEVAPGRFVLPVGITQEQWREVCRVVASNDWRFSRAILQEHMQIDNATYSDLYAAVTYAGVVVNNRVPANARRIFLSPERSE